MFKVKFSIMERVGYQCTLDVGYDGELYSPEEVGNPPLLYHRFVINPKHPVGTIHICDK